MITWLLAAFAVLMFLGVPIGLSLGLAAIGGIIIDGTSLVTITQRMFEGMNSWALLAVPLYTFAGYTMSKGGISDRLMDFCYSLADGESLTLSLGPRGFVYAPVCAGEEAGEAYVLLGEKVVGKIPLYYGAPVERQTEEKKSLWERIGGLLP